MDVTQAAAAGGPTHAERSSSFLVTYRCPDAAGIVARMTTALVGLDAWITESHQFSDTETDTFVMRTAFDAPMEDANAIAGTLNEALADFAGDLMVRRLDERPRVLVLVSKFEHCLVDLLYRQKVGELAGDIVGVVSNHNNARAISEHHGVDFTHLPVSPDSKPQAEAALLAMIEEQSIDLVVLARYMQILSNDLCQQIEGRAINIHHSFLPSFKGARPYHQAWERGVKQIGATAHYVTADLDEGPIIAQGVREVGHAESIKSLVTAGRDVERVVLSRAVQSHLEARVFLVGKRTVVFS